MSENHKQIDVPEALRAYKKPRLDIHETAYICCTTANQIRKEICNKGHYLGMRSIKVGIKHTFSIEDIAKVLQG